MSVTVEPKRDEGIRRNRIRTQCILGMYKHKCKVFNEEFRTQVQRWMHRILTDIHTNLCTCISIVWKIREVEESMNIRPYGTGLETCHVPL